MERLLALGRLADVALAKMERLRALWRLSGRERLYALGRLAGMALGRLVGM